MFSDAELSKIISDNLPEVPPDKKGALVLTVNNDGVSVIASFKKETKHGEWQFQGAVEKNWNNGIDLGTKVIWEF